MSSGPGISVDVCGGKVTKCVSLDENVVGNRIRMSAKSASSGGSLLQATSFLIHRVVNLWKSLPDLLLSAPTDLCHVCLWPGFKNLLS